MTLTTGTLDLNNYTLNNDNIRYEIEGSPGVGQYNLQEAIDNSSTAGYNSMRDFAGHEQVGIPDAPTGVSSSWTSKLSQITVQWDDMANADDYEVWRKVGAGGSYSLHASGVTNSVYGDTAVNSGNTYYYKMKACNIPGCSGFSAETSTTVP